MVCDLVVVVVGLWSMNGLGKYYYKGGSGGCGVVGVTVMVCVCYPGSNGVVGVYMVTEVVVLGWCVRACDKDSCSGVVVWFV